jgi:hypothetical protein
MATAVFGSAKRAAPRLASFTSLQIEGARGRSPLPTTPPHSLLKWRIVYAATPSSIQCHGS